MKKFFPKLLITFQIFLPFVLSYLSQRLSIGRGYQFTSENFKIILVNYLLWSTVFLFFISLFKKNYRSIIVYLIFFFIFTLANRYKIKFLNQPLKFNDFFLGRQLTGFVPMVIAQSKLKIELVIGTIGLIGSFFIIKKIFKFKNPKKIIRFFLFLITLLIFVFPVDFPNQFESLLNKNQIIFHTWDAAENCRNNGILLCFVYDFKYLKNPAPSNYSQSTIQKIYSSLPINGGDSDLSESKGLKPNIILILSESLWDATKFKNISYSQDPLKNIRPDIKSSFISPTFGGETANVEFELLTGLTNYFFDSSVYPYTQYLKKPMPSLFTMFKDNGYLTTAFHPYSPWFYNRDNVYKYLGVDKFTNLSNMSGYQNAGPFVSDKSFTDEVLNQLDSTNQSQFIFALSIQNHAPYEANRFSTHPISFKSSLDSTSQATLQSYIDGINLSDEAYSTLKTELIKIKKPTIVIFFGDHLPFLGDNFDIYRKANFDVTDQTKMHTTPLTIWSNFKTDLNLPNEISPSFLSLEILRLANITPKHQFSFIQSLNSTDTVLNQKIPTKLNTKQLKDYELIQYDLLFGKQYTLK